MALLPVAVTAVGARVGERARDEIARAASRATITADDALGVVKDVALLSLPLLAAIAATTAVVSLAQSGFARAGRRRPATVGARFRPLESLGVVVRAVVAGGFIAWVVARELRAHGADIVATTGRLRYVGPAAAALAGAVAWRVALFGLVLAAADVAWTRGLWLRRLRTTRSEAKRERREAEGDPLLRGAHEQAREELRARGGLEDVGRARMIVADGKQVACALRYDDGDRAPVVLVAGEGEDAARIVERAWVHGVSVAEDATLARALRGVAAGEPIPEASYDAVAEILRDIMAKGE